MNTSLFRKAALDRMASQERLDAPLRLVGTAQWMLLGCFVGLALVALAWAALTLAPVKVKGQGILIGAKGLAEIVAIEGGQIVQLMVAAGEPVMAGQVIATLSHDRLDREILDTSALLDEAKLRLDRLRGHYDQQDAREQDSESQRAAATIRTREELGRQLRFQDERQGQIASLVERGFVTRDTQVEVEIEVAGLRERMATLDQELQQFRDDRVRRGGENRLALLDAQNKVDDLQRQLAGAQWRLANETVVRAPASGLVVEFRVGAGDVVAAGSALATLVPEDASDQTIAVIYVVAGAGKRITPGMQAEVLPQTVERELYGYVRGRVLSIAPLPATREGMRRALRNDRLVDQLLAGGAVTEVRVALEEDAANPTGLAWSASTGPATGAGAGALVDAGIVIERKRVIRWLVPGSR